MHRLKQAIEGRNSPPESGLWETADDRTGLTRLAVATLYPFGLKRGVGSDTMNEFFARLHLNVRVLKNREMVYCLLILMRRQYDSWQKLSAPSDDQERLCAWQATIEMPGVSLHFCCR